MNEKLGRKKNTQKILTFRWKEKKKIKTTTESVSQSELVAINLSCQYIWYVYAAISVAASAVKLERIFLFLWTVLSHLFYCIWKLQKIKFGKKHRFTFEHL